MQENMSKPPFSEFCMTLSSNSFYTFEKQGNFSIPVSQNQRLPRSILPMLKYSSITMFL